MGSFMMARATIPVLFLGDAPLTAAYTQNLMPPKLVNTTPYELWSGNVPSLEHL